MIPIEYPETLHLQSAEGWLELGSYAEANEELDQIVPELRTHPDVLERRCHIYAATKQWLLCVDLAAAISVLAPDRAFGWLQRSYALHELKRTLEARDNLLPILENFPDNAILRYNLACYECQLGRLPHAHKWLTAAVELGGSQRMKLIARDDEDLRPLWDHIGEL